MKNLIGRRKKEQPQNDFTKGSIIETILRLALPMTLAQLINVLYSVIDRIYIGLIPRNATLSMTGIGLTLPITTIVIAFANLFGMGGAPLCSIARGRGEKEEAEKIMGNSFALLLLFSVILTILGLLFKKPLLYLFGASDETFPYANAFISIYLLGNLFVMVSLGMNSFINSQGFSGIGMATVLLGAITNIILDPIFIFVFHMGVRGAALSSVISQLLSALWVFYFLISKKALIRLRPCNIRLQFLMVKKISALGLSGFMMAITNSIVQIVCNKSLQFYGGDLYVGVMTVLNSIREIISMPVSGLTNGSQPVIGYNYGAGSYNRVRKAIKFISITCISYTLAAWGILHLFPHFFIRIFNHNAALVQAAMPAVRIYFFGFFMMSLQFAGQSVFVALGKAKYAVFFSILRKIVIVVPLTLLLPYLFHSGTSGVFWAEPVSNFIGGSACFLTMLSVVLKELKEKEKTLS
ncbi:MATE family efflux transporter [Anaerocolumna xylanovorans]|uniref:Multidrug export protein MepA n=1 Tax=Anaerocolumna xylanovorans DSM 12503 TaxID=1121345 RepID=A0A1M7YDW3_9FIRM|nr:MATE family efflux transporter [Anaerocolumna xylanovorans]SHO50793.1 putative efflux protein, MATE family [Anaerocolumna xylanovorans DSM 12503]